MRDHPLRVLLAVSPGQTATSLNLSFPSTRMEVNIGLSGGEEAMHTVGI